MSETPIIETGRLILRPRRVEDADALFPTFADPEMMTWWSTPPHESVAFTRARFARQTPGWRAWAITRPGDDTAIGMLSAGEKRQGSVVEIGYMLARSALGNGYAREAVTGLVDFLFAEGNRRVFADTDPENLPSRRLLETLGFTLEGRLRGEWQTHIGVRDSVIYGLLKNEWKARGG